MQYAHFHPLCGVILDITESDSMDYIISITDEQYQAYLESPDTWRVNLETLQLYQDESFPVVSGGEPVTLDSRVSVLEESDSVQNETMGAILEEIIPGLQI
jgi:hypothetical protein